ncbi:hypothetical protein BC940DRAFT_364348 [Gongronella butleri]|nr:hypothetical protein BC940DRAFT_364348 [Gongronella butleri]
MVLVASRHQSWVKVLTKVRTILTCPSIPPPPRVPVNRTWWDRMKRPSGVHPRHEIIVRYLGRVGFVAKGLVYAVMGGLCISTAQHLGTDLEGTESPMGAFIFLGLFTMGTPILIIMFISLLFYSLWRFWEGLLGQGSDATEAPFHNFFRYRFSPCVSGCVYLGYLSYIGKLLSDTRDERIQEATSPTGCFPGCWSSGNVWHRMAVGIVGVAFVFAFISQIQNGCTGRWHRDLMLHHCTRAERVTMLILGHLGFMARAGVFMFVAVFMFRSLIHSIPSQRDTFSNAINQIIDVHGGTVGLWFLGIGLILFGIFAAAHAYYKYFPTPPPTRYAFPRQCKKDELNDLCIKEEHSHISDAQEERENDVEEHAIPHDSAQDDASSASNSSSKDDTQEECARRSRITSENDASVAQQLSNAIIDESDKDMITVQRPPSPFERSRRFRYQKRRRLREESHA